MAQQTTTELNRTELMTRDTDRIRRLVGRDGDDLRRGDVPDEYDTHEALHAGDVWLTPDGEVVEVAAVDVQGSADSTTLTLVYHDREAPEGGDYSYETTAARLFARMEADGGWTRVPLAMYSTGPVNCPVCSGFMSTYPAHDDLAVGVCQCGGEKHHEDLVRDGEAVEVLV